MQFADGRTLARFSNCSPQLRGRADRIASEGLARITTLRLEQPAVADWRTELRLFAVITNPPNLWSLEGPDPAWVPINDHVKDYSTTLDFRTCYAELVTNYNLEDHRAYMVKYALRVGDAAVIEGVMRTTEPHERSMHVRNFYNRLYTRGRYLKNGPGSPAWCITGPECRAPPSMREAPSNNNIPAQGRKNINIEQQQHSRLRAEEPIASPTE